MPPKLPLNDAWAKLTQAPVQPWFAERLERAGVPTTRTCIKEEVRFKKSNTEVAWTGYELSTPFEADDEPGDGAEEHFEPAIYDYRVAECLAVLYPNDVAADWAARNWTPESLETMRALTNHTGNVNTGSRFGRSVFDERDEAYRENLVKMHEDSLRSEAPDGENLWEKDM